MAAILMNYKIPGYYIFFICLAVISCFSNHGHGCISCMAAGFVTIPIALLQALVGKN